MIDLHIHSTYSDGSKTIEEIIKEANDLQLSQFVITDHNTLKGSILAHELCPNKTIVGAELSVGYKNNEELHLLGYFKSINTFTNTDFIIKEGEIQKKLSISEMVERLNKQGYEISLPELREFTKGTINRVHICNALMKHGYIESVKEGFEKLVGNHCPAYVPRIYVPIKEAIAAIHNDGGIAILAHPYNYKNIPDVETLLNDVIDQVDGIECFHPSANPEQSAFLKEYVLNHHKRITGGSDYHGDNKPNIKLNMMKIEDIYQI